MRMNIAIRALPLGLLLLSGVAAVAVADDNVTTSTPGYIALKAGDYPAATRDFKASVAVTPHSPYDELDLGASYQHQGRMDLAEPLYRAAMTDGHGIMPTETTTARSKGHTVEEIACQNLAMGLPAAIEGTATPCQTTLIVAVAAPGVHSAYNTYFDFDKSTLTPDGRALVMAASKDAIANPTRRVALVGHASRVGTDPYNMALSQKRVDTVRDAMIADGVPAARIDITWVGERQLAVPEKEGVREPLNRVVNEQIK
jgi:outer membrane protein OmpA-like peptidoglycan-associated protein